MLCALEYLDIFLIHLSTVLPAVDLNFPYFTSIRILFLRRELRVFCLQNLLYRKYKLRAPVCFIYT